MINVSIDDYQVTTWLDGIIDKCAHLPLTQVGQLLVESVHENFRQEGRPDAWEARQDDLPHPLLRKTGNLYNSIYYEIVDNSEVLVDENSGYGQYHNEGTRNIPKREFLLVQPEDEVEIENILSTFLGT